MSTRCQIKIKDSKEMNYADGNIHIYKHSDGYPSDVLPVLVPFVKRFFKERGFDPIYLLCQIVRAFAVRDFQEAQGEYKTHKKEGDNFHSRQDYQGWGLDCDRHGDIRYLYEIDEKGDIFVNGVLVTEGVYKKLIKENSKFEIPVLDLK